MMKQFLLILLLFFTSLTAFSQIYQNPNPTLYGIRYNRGKFDSTLHYPTVCGKPVGRAALKDNVYNQSAFVFDSCHNHLYAFNPKDSSWLCVDSSVNVGGGSGNDTTAFHIGGDSINKKTVIGTKTNRSLYFITNNNITATMDSTYNFFQGSSYSSAGWRFDQSGDVYFNQRLDVPLLNASLGLIIPSDTSTAVTPYYGSKYLIAAKSGVPYFYPSGGNFKDNRIWVAKDTISTIATQAILQSYEPKIAASNTIKKYYTGYKTFATLLTDSINEGSTNLYFTTGRVRSSLSATSPLVYNSSTGSFSINTLDSSNVSGLHSEGYYNTKYAAVGSSGGLTGNGVVSSSIVPFATWSISNSKISSTVNYLSEDTTSGKITFNSSVTASGAKAIGTIITDTLKAAANGDTLSALELAPTFISNGKTGLTNAVLRWSNGNIVERGSVLPYSYGSTDVILKQNTQLISAYNANSTYYGYIQLQNSTAQMTLGTTYNGRINFVIGSNTSYFDGSGNLFCNGSANIGNTGSLTAIAPNGTIGNIFPMNSSGQTIIQNGYANSSASIIFKTSPITNGIFVEQARFTYGGKFLLNTTSDDSVNQLQVNGSAKATQYRLSALNTAPVSSTDTGTTGEIRVTSTYIYICTTTNTWVRTALSTF